MAVREIGTDIKLTGEKEFNDGMKAINSNLKTLKSDMAAVSATFEDNANSVEALTAKNKILQDTVDQQRVKVDALRQMYEKVTAASGENSAAADRWKQQLNNATVALAKEEKALRQNNEALEKAKSSTDSAENAAEDLADANNDVARSSDRAADELDDMAEKAEKTGSILPSVAQGLGQLASGALQAGAAVVAVGAAMGTAALTAMVSFAKESAEAARAAQEAGETLDASQLAWLAYADKLDVLDESVARAKSALGGVLLPQLSKLSRDGASYLDSFARSMEAAGNDSEKQAKVISEYVVVGATLLKTYIPEYLKIGKDLLGGLKDGLTEIAPDLMDEGIDLLFDFLDAMIEGAPEMGQVGNLLLDKLITGMGQRGPALLLAGTKLLGELVVGIADNAKDLIPVAGELVLSLVIGIAESLPEIGAAAGELLGYLASYLIDHVDELVEAGLTLGASIAKAIWEGLKSLWNQIADIPGLLDGLNAAQNYQSSGKIAPVAIPGHASGLHRVPYDNYLARLHKDEMVLTASEAERYRNGRRSDKLAAVINLIFNAKTITREDAEMVAEVINEKLGDLIE